MVLRDGLPKKTMSCGTVTIFLSWIVAIVVAEVPTAEIDVTYNVASNVMAQRITGTSDYDKTTTKKTLEDGRYHLTMLATQASFGALPPMKREALRDTKASSSGSDSLPNYKYGDMTPVFVPEASEDPYLCNPASSDDSDSEFAQYDETYVMLIPRGVCTFERKVLNAQNRYKVGAVIIYGSLSSRYGYNETEGSVIYPQDKNDYDCAFGEGHVEFDELSFDADTGLYDPSNDAVVNDQCDQTSSKKKTCSSHKCLLTGPPQDGNAQICCAWDLHIWLYADPSIPANTTDTIATIPAFYITMSQVDLLRDAITYGERVTIDLYSRTRPEYNFSGILVWALGVFTAVLAAYLSSGDIRDKRVRFSRGALIQPNDDNDDSDLAASAISRVSRTDQVAERRGSFREKVRSCSPRSQDHEKDSHGDETAKLSPRQQEDIVATSSTLENPPHEDDGDEDILEITLTHALIFIVWSSASLFILFYLKIYSVVKVMYALGCSGALSQVMIRPLFNSILSRHYQATLDRIVFTTEFLEIGSVSCLDFSSTLMGYVLGIGWLITAFVANNPESIAYFWILQDLMGISVCVVFLAVMRMNNLKVATVLLSVAFFYDIFFVFITPYLLKSGQSVMVTVATSGGPPKADPLWCEKYPSDNDCKGGDPLPMLLTLPRFNDYLGGSSLLGLGDIVLPGLILSFASRLDEAKRLVGALSTHDEETSSSSRGGGPFCFKGGYFGPAVVAYAIGLAMANVAVYVTRMGQPALLYLVPMCLGTFYFMGWRNNETSDLWNGHRILTTADEIVRGSVAMSTADCVAEENTNNELMVDRRTEESNERDSEDFSPMEGESGDNFGTFT